MFPPDPGDYRRADGSVVVPARAVAAFTRLVTKGVLAGRARGDFSVDVDWAVLGDSIAEARPGSANGTTIGRERRLEGNGKPLTTQQAADRIGCSERAVRKACDNGRLRADKVGRAWLISEGELERFRFGSALVTDHDNE